MKEMIFVTAQPHNLYFVWQIAVQIVNFRKFGISDKMHVCVWYPEDDKVDFKPWMQIAKKYPEVHFFFYKDTGVDLGLYIPQLRPQILAKHFDKYPELKEKVIFYHDSDIIFNYLPDFQSLIKDDINWQSDTSGYLDYNYLRRKEEEGKIPENEAISILCEIGNISVDIMKSYIGKTGGAQYILKGIDGDFWRDVERMCLHIRGSFMHGSKRSDDNTPSVNTKYFPNEASGFQSWCADMWAVNMALWSRNKVTDVTSELDFSWATDTSEVYQTKPIFHNAGATGKQPGVFYKGKWINESPIGKHHKVSRNSASYFYVKAINEVK